MTGRYALIVATHEYQDAGLKRLIAPQHDAELLAEILADQDIAAFDVTMLVNEPHYVVGEAIGDFFSARRGDDLSLLYFSGHGLKDDEGRLFLAMTNTRRDGLLFTALPAESVNDAMNACLSREKVLILDCCYSGAFPHNWTTKSDSAVNTLERFRGGRGKVVLTASDATQYSFEGNELRGAGSASVFTHHLVEGLRSGAADQDQDGDIALDELYAYVYDRVVAEMPQQRPKKMDDVEGRIVIAHNVQWDIPGYIRNALGSPIPSDRLQALTNLTRLHANGNPAVRTRILARLKGLLDDDSKQVSQTAVELYRQWTPTVTPDDTECPQVEKQASSSEKHRLPAQEAERMHQPATPLVEQQRLKPTPVTTAEANLRQTEAAEKAFTRQPRDQERKDKVSDAGDAIVRADAPTDETQESTAARTDSSGAAERTSPSRFSVSVPPNTASLQEQQLGATGKDGGKRQNVESRDVNQPPEGRRQDDTAGVDRSSKTWTPGNIVLLGAALIIAGLVIILPLMEKASRNAAFDELVAHLPAAIVGTCVFDVPYGDRARTHCSAGEYSLHNTPDESERELRANGEESVIRGDCSTPPTAPAYYNVYQEWEVDGRSGKLWCYGTGSTYSIQWSIHELNLHGKFGAPSVDAYDGTLSLAIQIRDQVR